MISHRSYQVFGTKKGQIFHIKDVDRGLSCDCACPHCKSLLVAKKGNINIHHFAHVASGKEVADCGYGNQTALHLMAKKILLTEGYIVLPELNVSAYAFDINDKQHYASKTIPPYRLLIEQVADECVLDGIIPDIIIKSGDKELFVEIAVTNFVNARKRDWLEQRNKTCIQIDLSRYYESIGLTDGWDFNKLRYMLVESILEKSWVNNPKKTALYDMLLAQVRAEADKVKKIKVEETHPLLQSTRKPAEPEPKGEIIKKQGICQICNNFTKENDWWYFECSTMTCKCNMCLRCTRSAEV